MQYKFSVPAFRGDELGKEKKKEEEKTTEKEKMILRECWVRKIELKELKERSRRTRF